MRKISFDRLRERVNPIADRTALHCNDRLVSVLTFRCCGQTVNIFRIDLAQVLLKGKRGHMMALVNDDHTVVFDKIPDLVAADDGLHDRDINDVIERVFRRAELTNMREFSLSAACFGLFGQLVLKYQKLR